MTPAKPSKAIIIAILAMAAVLALAVWASSATYSPSPMPKAQFFDNSGRPLSGGRVWTYVPGTTTLQTTYSDAAGTVPNANPVVLDSAGRASIFLNGYYDMSVYTSAGVQLYTSYYVGNPSLSTATTYTGSQWVDTGFTPTRTGNSTFTVSGDKTATFSPGRRISSTNTTGTIYSTVVSASYTPTTTLVTVINDTGNLDSGMSSVSVGILTAANNAIPVYQTQIKTGDYNITTEDHGKIFEFSKTGDSIVTLPSASLVPSGTSVLLKTTGVGTVLIQSQVGSNPTTTLYQDDAIILFSDGTPTWHGALISVPVVTPRANDIPRRNATKDLLDRNSEALYSVSSLTGSTAVSATTVTTPTINVTSGDILFVAGQYATGHTAAMSLSVVISKNAGSANIKFGINQTDLTDVFNSSTAATGDIRGTISGIMTITGTGDLSLKQVVTATTSVGLNEVYMVFLKKQ